MKLTDEQIFEIALREKRTYDNGYVAYAESIIAIARAIEYACQPRWLPIESAPRDGSEILLRHSTLGVKIGQNDSGTDIPSDAKDDPDYFWIEGRDTLITGFTGWMPLPEVE